MVKLALLALLVLGLLQASEQKRGLLASYWGQFDEEGSLKTACGTGRYDIIMLAFLSSFGGGRAPQLNLAGHCDVPSGECRSLAKDIRFCQRRDVKVLLSLGGAENTYSLKSDREAEDLASFLWDNFLGGNSGLRPLGDAVLDGIDFDIEHGGFAAFAHLARTLKSMASSNGKTILLGAAPQCPFEDASLGPGSGSALSTGLFDFVWVQFYNNEQCHYDPSKKGDVSNMIDAWDQWTRGVPEAKVYLGLPASPDAASGSFSLRTGFLPTDVLLKELLPRIKRSRNYGGVMLWSVFHDKKHTGSKKSYSSVIRSSL